METRNLNPIGIRRDGTKQFRIIAVRTWPDGKGTDGYISKRVIRYQTPFGENSAGSEIEYKTIDEALKAENEWCYQ